MTKQVTKPTNLIFATEADGKFLVSEDCQLEYCADDGTFRFPTLDGMVIGKNSVLVPEGDPRIIRI